MSEQDGIQASALKPPTTDDPKAWIAYWKAQGQPWRTEPEINTEQQKYLAERRISEPDIQKGIYPFKAIKLSRADVEWLLATDESGGRCGPVDWSDEHQREREGLDLRGADLCGVILARLPLARMRGGLGWKEWPNRTQEQRDVAAVLLEQADLNGTHLEGADLSWAQLKGADLFEVRLEEANLQGTHLEKARLYRAQLKGAHLFKAQLRGADLSWAHLEGADLSWAHLEGTFLKGAHLEGTDLEKVTMGDEKRIGPRLADVHWGDTNLAVVKWSHVEMLGDEHDARQKIRDGQVKDKETRQKEYEVAVRANRLLAITLQAQGLNEEAAHFAYLAQCLARGVMWFQMGEQGLRFRQRVQRLGAWLFSWFLNLVAGYGYKPLRCLVMYFLALVGFTLAHYIVGAVAGPHLTILNALAVSVQSLHGRIFSFQSGDPQTLLNTIEAFVGLFIEAIIVAVITQRILGK
jgi:uncharacterized protein YjbI with pentapeptide repeats